MARCPGDDEPPGTPFDDHYELGERFTEGGVSGYRLRLRGTGGIVVSGNNGCGCSGGWPHAALVIGLLLGWLVLTAMVGWLAREMAGLDLVRGAETRTVASAPAVTPSLRSISENGGTVAATGPVVTASVSAGHPHPAIEERIETHRARFDRLYLTLDDDVKALVGRLRAVERDPRWHAPRRLQ